jgi:hypothetical protein
MPRRLRIKRSANKKRSKQKELRVGRCRCTGGTFGGGAPSRWVDTAARTPQSTIPKCRSVRIFPRRNKHIPPVPRQNPSRDSLMLPLRQVTLGARMLSAQPPTCSTRSVPRFAAAPTWCSNLALRQQLAVLATRRRRPPVRGRPLVLAGASPLLVAMDRSAHGREAGDGGPLAPRRLP